MTEIVDVFNAPVDATLEIYRLRHAIEQALAHLGDQSMARCDRITWAVRTLQQALGQENPPTD